MKYSLPKQQNNNSVDINNHKPIDFYKMAKPETYHMPIYNTVKATDFNTSIRKPLANPIPEVSSNQVKSLTKPKATYPVNPTYTAEAFQQAKVIYENNYDQLSTMETYLDPMVNNYNMVATELDHSIFHTPVGVSLMPLYGFDSYDDAEKDYDYMKQLFPVGAKKILLEVNEECDKLEYEGSCMFDEYPDRVHLGRIVDRIYDKTKHLFEDSVHAAEFEQEYARRGGRRPDRRPPGRRDPIKDLIEILFYHEILNRRRRYRGRRRWF